MAYVDSTTNSGNSTTPSVPVPTGVQSGDIVIIACGFDLSTAAFDPADLPTGFTELDEQSVTADGHRGWAGWKRLTGADAGSYTFGAVAGSALDWVCQAIALRGRHATNPPVISTANIQNTPQSSPITISANGVTAVDGDDLVWISVPDVTSSGIGDGHTPPTNYTEAEDAELAWSNLSIAYRENVSAGATGTISGTFALTANTAGWLSWLIRVPASAGNTVNAEARLSSSTGVVGSSSVAKAGETRIPQRSSAVGQTSVSRAAESRIFQGSSQRGETSVARGANSSLSFRSAARAIGSTVVTVAAQARLFFRSLFKGSATVVEGSDLVANFIGSFLQIEAGPENKQTFNLKSTDVAQIVMTKTGAKIDPVVIGDDFRVTRIYTGLPIDLVIDKAWFTIRVSELNPSALLSKEITPIGGSNGHINVAAATEGRLEMYFDPSKEETATALVATYVYDIQVRSTGGKIHTMEIGTIPFINGVTHVVA